MDLSLSRVLSEVQFTLRSPRESARQILRMDLPDTARWTAFALVSVGSAIGTHLSIAVLPPEQRDIMQALFSSPVTTALLQAGIWLVITFLITTAGRELGGKGRFGDGLLLVAWLMFILLCVQAVQVALGVVLPPLADLVGLAGLVLMIWLMTNFVAELHGFTALWRVFLGLVIGAIGFILALSILLAIFIGGSVPRS